MNKTSGMVQREGRRARRGPACTSYARRVIAPRKIIQNRIVWRAVAAAPKTVGILNSACAETAINRRSSVHITRIMRIWTGGGARMRMAWRIECTLGWNDGGGGGGGSSSGDESWLGRRSAVEILSCVKCQAYFSGLANRVNGHGRASPPPRLVSDDGSRRTPHTVWLGWRRGARPPPNTINYHNPIKVPLLFHLTFPAAFLIRRTFCHPPANNRDFRFLHRAILFINAIVCNRKICIDWLIDSSVTLWLITSRNTCFVRKISKVLLRLPDFRFRIDQFTNWSFPRARTKNAGGNTSKSVNFTPQITRPDVAVCRTAANKPKPSISLRYFYRSIEYKHIHPTRTANVRARCRPRHANELRPSQFI